MAQPDAEEGFALESRKAAAPGAGCDQSARDKEVSHHQKKSMGALAEINRRHQVGRAVLFTQKHFQRRFKLDIPIGLCAGLIQVWWSEIRKGRDAIKSILEAGPKLIGDVLLAQARSFYLEEFPPKHRRLRSSEVRLLEFKYGEHRASSIESLYRAFGVTNCLELDIALLHGLPIVKNWVFSYNAADIVKAFMEGVDADLYVFVTRFWRSRQERGEKGHRGHRTALVIEPTGLCRFYDPRRGEMLFAGLDHFTEWFPDYWTIEQRDYQPQRNYPVPVQLFALGGRPSPEAIEKSEGLERRFAGLNFNVEELRVWLKGLRPAPESDPLEC